MRPPSSVPEVVADQACHAAGSPCWHPQAGLLFWTDLTDGRLLFFDPASAKGAALPGAPKVLACAPRDDGSLLLLLADGGMASFRVPDAVATRAGTQPWGLQALLAAAAVDGRGRLYCAAHSSSEKSGSLYQVRMDGTTEEVPLAVGRITAMDFDSSGNLYCCEAGRRKLLRFSAHGQAFSEPQAIFQVPQSLGAPHGLALDAKGHLWVAVWGGSCILRISPSGREEQRVYFTAKLVSGLAFGGPDLRDLYVATSGAEDRKANGPGAGALFRLRPGVKGLPKHPVSAVT